jgi:glycosyltransferase involved in cell wall biosynthesis
MRENKKKICFIYRNLSSFVKTDIDLLSKHFIVRPFQFKFRAIHKLLYLIRTYDLVFIWFASYHAFITTILAKIAHRPIIIVTGGYDVAKETEINYGLMQRTAACAVRYTLLRAKSILAVSKFNQEEVLRNTGIGTTKLVYNCIDYKNFIPGIEKKQDIVLTVASVDEEMRAKVKGIDTFMGVAKVMSDVKFIAIGITKEVRGNLDKIKPDNVTVLGLLSPTEILQYYRIAKVYCQLSYYESFGVALCEAMLCECVPVVTNRGALPEIVGDDGFYTEYGNIAKTISAIEKAMCAKEYGKKARRRIIENFNPGIREKQIKEIVEGALK